jgi:hypothetical protein
MSSCADRDPGLDDAPVLQALEHLTDPPREVMLRRQSCSGGADTTWSWRTQAAQMRTLQLIPSALAGSQYRGSL